MGPVGCMGKIGAGLCLLAPAASAHGASMQWTGIRDGSLYLQTDQPSTVTVRWVPAWQADANTERLYLLDGQGRAPDVRILEPGETLVVEPA